MPNTRTATFRTYGSRGSGARTRTPSDDIIVDEEIPESSAHNGAKTSFSALKRKCSSPNLHSFFGGAQTLKKPKLSARSGKSIPKDGMVPGGTYPGETIRFRNVACRNSGRALRLPNGDVGRIVRIRCDVTKGKLGQKVTMLLSTINKALSAPSLPGSGLSSSKAYVMIIPAKPNAMRVIDSSELESSDVSKSNLVCVDIDDSSGNVYCDPTPIPATLGIPRLFVVPSHRRQGIAQALLNAAAKTAVWGCPLDPTGGQIAFSQPTASGRAIMKAWGGDSIHIYDEQ
ncbi:zinc-finger of acetyl-transferase ESCO [Rhizoctonia solani]|uniref:Zinc-finger of acetyl-transferase ESCO n=1 Tax=Rhizoctonia solani TaxID=456999 RepID=A0A8H7M096_9AGAM|nr:zinc-finger of acetyl-transferase ESCO [Rhizoctonia solani]